MKRYLMGTLLIALVYAGKAQEGMHWKITLNKKVALTGTNFDDTTANQLQVKKEELSNNNLFKIEYFDKNEKGGKGSWVRTIALYDSSESELVKKDSTKQLMFYNKDLLKLIWARKKIYIYTWSSPPDPGMAAAIRIRRLRMCKLELVD